MKTVLVLLMLILSGCASLDAAQSAIAGNSAKAADEMRETAEWTLCSGISVGAWRRAYAGDPGKADGWRRLCAQPDGAPQ